jgi:hypothetical protein
VLSCVLGIRSRDHGGFEECEGPGLYFLFYKSKGSDRRLIACLENEDTASNFARVWSKFWLSPIDIVHNSADGAAVIISRYTGGTLTRHAFTPTFAR